MLVSPGESRAGDSSAPVCTFRASEKKEGRYVTRSCFGGSGQAFVACGGGFHVSTFLLNLSRFYH
jgi:hypothetical protein